MFIQKFCKTLYVQQPLTVIKVNQTYSIKIINNCENYIIYALTFRSLSSSSPMLVFYRNAIDDFPTKTISFHLCNVKRNLCQYSKISM